MSKAQGLEKRRRRAGVLFTLPWVIGFLGVFVRPLLTAVVYSVSTTQITTSGMQTAFAGMGTYLRAFTSDMYYLRYLAESVGKMISSLPLILAFSLLMAVIIHGDFKGRTLVRTIFFLPVICGSGQVLSIMNGDALSNSIISGARASMLFQTSGIDSWLRGVGMSSDLVSSMMGVVNGVFDLTWKSGLQIILFLSGLLSISPSLYEAARVEGATAWESFWKITFPMLTPILLLNLIYTLIDGLTDTSSTVMQYIYSFSKQLDFSYSSTLALIYFAVIMVIVGATYLIINRHVVYTVE